MTDPEKPSSQKDTLPFLILAISVIILLVWMSRTMSVLQSAAITTSQPPVIQAAPQPVQPPPDNATLNNFLVWQAGQVAMGQASIDKSKEQLEDYIATNIPKYDAEADKADQVTEALKKLAGDVYELAKTDDNAKQVVENLEKAGIKFQPSPTPSPSPAP